MTESRTLTSAQRAALERLTHPPGAWVETGGSDDVRPLYELLHLGLAERDEPPRYAIRRPAFTSARTWRPRFRITAAGIEALREADAA